MTRNKTYESGMLRALANNAQDWCNSLNRADRELNGLTDKAYENLKKARLLAHEMRRALEDAEAWQENGD